MEQKGEEEGLVEGIFSWSAAWCMMLWIIALILSVGMGLLTYTGGGIMRISEESLGDKSVGAMKAGGLLPPLDLKISLSFADGQDVQEVLNTNFQLLGANGDLQSLLLQHLTEMEARQLHEKLQGIQTLARTGSADLPPLEKTVRLVLGRRHTVRRSASDPGKILARRPPPPRSAKSAESLTPHEQSDAEEGLGEIEMQAWRAKVEDTPAKELKRKATRSKPAMPTIREQPEGEAEAGEGTPSTTDESDFSGSEGSDEAAGFSEVPDDLPVVAPPTAGERVHFTPKTGR
eukprot:g23876.t1